MLQDLEVLTPSLVVCAAFLIGLVMFLRRQMSDERPAGDREQAEIPDGVSNAAGEGAPPPSSPPGITR